MASGNDPANIPYIIVENGFYYVAYKEKVKVPEVVVSSKGIANGLSEEYNDGWDFGPDSYSPTSTSAIPYTQSGGILEAKEALPKVKNLSTGRLVPSGKILIKFGGQPITISQPLNFYDDEFVSLISYDGFTLPIQPPNTPVVYITNSNSPNILNIYRNPAGSSIPNGILEFDGFVLMNTISSSSSSPQTLFNSVGNGSDLPNPSEVKIGSLGIYDKTGTNGLITLATNGNDDNYEIGNLVAIGATGSQYNMVVIGVTHLAAKLIHLLSTTYTSVGTNTGDGWMFYIAPGGNANIEVLDCFAYGANGVIDVEPGNGTQSLTGAKLNIETFLDETSGVQNNARNDNAQVGSSSFRAVTVITNLSAAGEAFQAIASGYSQYLDILTGLVSFLSSTTNGTTAGTVAMNAVIWSPLDRKYSITFSGYENDTTTDQTIDFPMPFINTPQVIVNTTGLTISASTSGITITAPDSTTTYSGIVIVEGY